MTTEKPSPHATHVADSTPPSSSRSMLGGSAWAPEYHRTGREEFYGLELAQRRRRYDQLTQFGRESVIHARRGARVFGRQLPTGWLRRLRSVGVSSGPMEFTARRIVTGHDADG